MNSFKSLLKSLPLIGPTLIKINQLRTSFNFKSGDYWELRYATGGNSGSGSYGRLAEFKNETINKLVIELNIQKVIEFGCGDGNQLLAAKYPEYLGLDVSKSAIKRCREKFSDRKHFQFKELNQYDGEKASLVLSLDVIYHLVEPDVFANYMRSLFDASSEYVLIYSVDGDDSKLNSFHVKTRKFSEWISLNIKDWKLLHRIPNRYPFDKSAPDETSMADFYLYQKAKLK